MRKINIVHQTTLVSMVDALAAVAAMQKQVDEHFEPAYPGMGCLLTTVEADPNAPHTPTVETIYILDHSDQAGALGYHTETQTGVPVGYAFVADTLDAGYPWQPTLSHELLEQLADRWADLCVPVRLSAAFGRDAGRGAIVAYEAADAVEDDTYDIDGVPVSNFVLPAWYDGAGSRYDYLGRLQAPLTLTSGGYVSYLLTGRATWSQTSMPRKAPHSRFHRRRRRHKARRLAA